MLSTWLLTCCHRRWNALDGDMKCCYYLFPLFAPSVCHQLHCWHPRNGFDFGTPAPKRWCQYSLILHCCLKNQSSSTPVLTSHYDVIISALIHWLQVVWDPRQAEAFVLHFLCSDKTHYESIFDPWVFIFLAVDMWTLTLPLTSGSCSPPATYWKNKSWIFNWFISLHMDTKLFWGSQDNLSSG